MATRTGNEVVLPPLAHRSRGPRGLLQGLLHFARKKPVGAVGGVVIILVVLAAIFADGVAPYGPLEFHRGDRLLPPSSQYFLGTDEIGRDVLSRIIHGARISLYVGFIAVSVGTTLGTIVGLISGYFVGKVDLIVQRVVDSMMAFPGLILALAMVSILGPSTTNAMIAISIVIIPANSRVVRSAVLSVKENQYIEAARALGAKNLRILLNHVLPNVGAPILVLATVELGSAIIIEASLSFLGLGTQPPTPSWGIMLSASGRRYMEQAPWLAVAPGVAISLTVLGFNMLGDALRDVWDPRLRGS